MSIASQVRVLRLETDVINMVRVGNVAFCFLLTLKCSLCKGSIVNIETRGKSITLQKEFTNDWKCDSDLDCTVPNTSCINSICQCPIDYIYNGQMTACIKVAGAYGDNCEESIQCSRYLFSGAICVDNVCVCTEGYYYVHGRCNAYTGLYNKCHNDYDCFVNADYGASFCNNGICKCSPEFYQREYRTCRPEGKHVGDKCVINNDCRFNRTAYCDDFKCAVTKLRNIVSETVFLDNFDVPQENYTVKSEAGMDSKCSTNKDCEDFENALCGPLATCICKRAHFFSEETGKCIPELGEPCQVTDTAVIEYSQCENGKWNCEPGKVASTNNRQCDKATRKYNYSCLYNKQCYIFGPDAICKGGRCVCNENSHFVESESFCWIKKKLGEKCQQDIDCYTDDMSNKPTCENNVCSCPNGTQANFNRTSCWETGIGINSTCTINNDCIPANSECKADRCTCKENYVAASFNSCIPVVSFGNPCQKDIQCSTTISNAICSAVDNANSNKTCICDNGYHYNFNKCYKRKGLGVSCENLGECYLDSDKDRVVCKNGQCACDWGYIKVNDIVCGISSKTQRYINGSTIRSISGGSLLILLLLTSFSI